MALNREKLLIKFVAEVQENVKIIRDGLQQFIALPEERNVLDSPCTAAHSIKTSAKMMQRSAMSRIAELLGNMMQDWRSGDKSTSSHSLDLALQALDQIEKQTQAGEQGNSFQESEWLIRSLEMAIGISTGKLPDVSISMQSFSSPPRDLPVGNGTFHEFDSMQLDVAAMGGKNWDGDNTTVREQVSSPPVDEKPIMAARSWVDVLRRDVQRLTGSPGDETHYFKMEQTVRELERIADSAMLPHLVKLLQLMAELVTVLGRQKGTQDAAALFLLEQGVDAVHDMVEDTVAGQVDQIPNERLLAAIIKTRTNLEQPVALESGPVCAINTVTDGKDTLPTNAFLSSTSMSGVATPDNSENILSQSHVQLRVSESFSKFRWSIRKILLFLSFSSVMAAVVLMFVGMYSNYILNSNQDRLLGIVLPLETSSRKVVSTLNNLLSRQRKIISAQELEVFHAVPKRQAMETDYRQAYQQLVSVLHETQDAGMVLDPLDRSYEDFLVSDDHLFERKKSLIILEDRLRHGARELDANIARIENIVETMVGKLALSEKRMKRNYRKILDDKPEFDKMASALREIVLGSRMEVQQTSYDVRYLVAKLGMLNRKMMLENNIDNLTSINNNEIKQTIEIVQRAVGQLGQVNDEELSELKSKLENEINRLILLFVSGQENIFSLRSGLLKEERELKTLQDEAVARSSDLVANLDALSKLLERIGKDTQQESGKIATSSNLVLMIIGAMVIIGMVVMVTRVTGWMLSRIKQVTEVLLVLGRGHLGRRVYISKYQDEMDTIGQGINSMADNLGLAIRTVTELAAKMRQYSAEISTSVGNQAKVSSNQSAAFTEITTTMEELSVSSVQVVKHAEHVRQLSDHALERTRNGAAAVNSVMHQMSDINQDNEKSTNEIVQLGRKSKEIAKIMGMINTIADQTKLLAFNASLEAASAGEAGKRFSVVAVEIRHLADSVMTSTKEIETHVEEIQEAINRLVVGSEKSRKQVQEGLSLTTRTTEVLETVVKEVTTTSSAAKSISLSTQQQQVASEQILITLKDLRGGVLQNSTSINQTNEIIKNLNKIASGLASQLARFELEK
ncbi:MAG: Hpt domain-containing protein [Nitrospirae bacterium]|nr:Hpt domain-containing protein [Magnetococcales bacterium]